MQNESNDELKGNVQNMPISEIIENLRSTLEEVGCQVDKYSDLTILTAACLIEKAIVEENASLSVS